MASPFQSPAVLSFCSGTIGLERGIERAIGPVRTVAYVEIEAFLVENLVKQMEKGVLAPAPVFTNLKTFDAREFRNKIHGITAGYPCQPFSVAGEQKGKEDPRHLFPYLLDIVNTVRPVWCFFENVRGHLSLGYDEVQRSLHDIGYAVEPGIFSAAEAGATHERERLFILAMENTSLRGFSGSGIFGEQSRRTKTFGRGKAMEHTDSNGSMSGVSGSQQREERQPGIVNYGSLQRFPAPPGYEQYEWEAPRLISGMGCTVNGYNFREDLLRCLGNGVVEQTAEIAWVVLWNKMMKNLK